MKKHPPWIKPQDIGYTGWVEVWGLCGLSFGWHIAHWSPKKKRWYHHQYASVSFVTMWREAPNPNDKKRAREAAQ